MADRRSPAETELEALERSVLDAVGRNAVVVPPYPAIALRVNEAASNSGLGLAEVSRIINADAALAADVLRCANSAFFRRGAAVTSLTQAVTRIGGQEVMRIALAASLGVHARVAGPLSTVRRMIWIENLAGAAICQELARLRGLRAEEAFMLGLLHDFGKIVACSALEWALADTRSRSAWTLEAWTEIIARLHVPVGRAMATRWRLPPLLVDVISSHHQESPPSPAHDGLLAIVKASDEVVALLTALPGVRSEELARVATLTEGERNRVAHAIELLPELIAAFEPAAPGATPPPEPSAVAHAEAPPAARPRSASLRVSISVARRAREYSVSALDGEVMVVSGEASLPEHRLVEVVLEGTEQFRMWALVQRSRPQGQGFTLELRPFALNALERSCWDRLTASARERAD